jgi:hypothetical protein
MLPVTRDNRRKARPLEPHPELSGRLGADIDMPPAEIVGLIAGFLGFIVARVLLSFVVAPLTGLTLTRLAVDASHRRIGSDRWNVRLDRGDGMDRIHDRFSAPG